MTKRALVVAAFALALLASAACKKATFCGEYPDLCPTNEGGAGGGSGGQAPGGQAPGGEAPGGASP